MCLSCCFCDFNHRLASLPRSACARGSMPDHNFSAMRQSIIDGAPETASGLAQQAVSSGVAPIDAINQGYVPGMHDVGEQFARGQMYLPDMMASAEAMRAAMAVLGPELKKLGTERPMA